MKKVLSLILIMILALIVLTGCVDVNYEVTLNKDGTADIAYIYGFEKASLEQLGTNVEDMTSDMKQNAKESGYTIETYADDEIEGFKAKKHVENLSDVSLEEAFGASYIKDSEENKLKIEKNGMKTTYSQNANIDLTSLDETTASMVTLKYTVNLPVKAGENNADEVSNGGKTLTWNLTAGEANEVSFNASSNMLTTIILAVVIALVVIAIVVIVVVAVKNKKTSKNKEENEKQDI